MKKKQKKIFTCGLLLLLFFSNINSAKLDIPARIQVGMFTKIFKYNESLKNKPFIKLIIIYNEKYQIDMEKMKEAFNNASIDCDAIIESDIQEQIYDYDIIYFMPGSEKIAENIDKKNLLSISGSSIGVENGFISIGLDLVNNQPRIFINQESLKKENHKFSAQLMKISIIK